MSDLPTYLRADIRDGMNPAKVLAIYCRECGKYLGQWRDFEDVWDEDDVICEICDHEMSDYRPPKESEDDC